MQPIERALEEIRALHDEIAEARHPDGGAQAPQAPPPGTDPVAYALREVARLRQEVEQTRAASRPEPPTPVTWVPRASIYAGDAGSEVVLEIPGVARQDVEVTVAGGELVVRGERKLPELDMRARFTMFLYPVVRHLALARRRRGGREIAVDSPPEPAVRDEPLASREDLAHVVGGLPPEQRDAVMLRFVDDLSLAAVAAELRVPVGTVKSRLHQALRTLREDPRTRRYFLPSR